MLRLQMVAAQPGFIPLLGGTMYVSRRLCSVSSEIVYFSNYLPLPGPLLLPLPFSLSPSLPFLFLSLSFSTQKEEWKEEVDQGGVVKW